MSKRKSNKRYISQIAELKQQLITASHWQRKWREWYYRLKAETVSKEEHSDIQKKFVMSNNLAIALRRKLDKCEQLCERISTQFSISADQDTINKLEAELKELSEFKRSALDTMAIDRQTIAELRDQIKDYTIDFSEKDQPVLESVNGSVDVTVAEEKLKLFEKMFDAATDNTYLLSDQVSQFKEILCETTDNVISLNKTNGELRRENNELKSKLADSAESHFLLLERATKQQKENDELKSKLNYTQLKVSWMLKSELTKLQEYESPHPETWIVENTEMIELLERFKRLKKEALINTQQYDQILKDKETEYRNKIKSTNDVLDTYIAAADELRKEFLVNKNDLSKCRETCETLTKENHDRQQECQRLRVTNKKLLRDNDLWVRQRCDIFSVAHNGVIEALRMIESQPELIFCNQSFVSNITTHMNILRNNIEKCISLPADLGFADDDDGRESAFGLSNAETMKKAGRTRTDILNDKINSMNKPTHELVQENQMLKEQLSAIDSLSTTDMNFYAAYVAIREQYGHQGIGIENPHNKLIADNADLKQKLDLLTPMYNSAIRRRDDLASALKASEATNKELVEKNRQLSREVAEQKNRLKETYMY